MWNFILLFFLRRERKKMFSYEWFLSISNYLISYMKTHHYSSILDLFSSPWVVRLYWRLWFYSTFYCIQTIDLYLFSLSLRHFLKWVRFKRQNHINEFYTTSLFLIRRVLIIKIVTLLQKQKEFKCSLSL
jgi:hypothetical protein